MARLVTKFKYLKPDQDFTKASMCGRVHTKPISYNKNTHELKILVQNPVAKGYWGASRKS